jgi:hypothetical protein
MKQIKCIVAIRDNFVSIADRHPGETLLLTEGGVT